MLSEQAEKKLKRSRKSNTRTLLVSHFFSIERKREKKSGHPIERKKNNQKSFLKIKQKKETIDFCAKLLIPVRVK